MGTLFKRKIYDKLLAWKTESNGHTALMINGARRVGKSTIATEFAKNEYRSYIIIDFSKPRPGVLELFDYIYDMDLFFSRLSIFYPERLYDRESLIVFDEIQLFPKARQAIKHLVADGRFDYIETGSLISISKNVDSILIPSEEECIEMHPMDYEEFLWALGDDLTYDNIRRLRNDEREIGQNALRFLMNSFRSYILVGGMPQAVSAYIETKNFLLVDNVKRTILKLYEEDFYKIDPQGRISILFDSIPSLLAKHISNFRESALLKGSSKSEEMLQLLVQSMTVNISYNATDPSVGLALSRNPDEHRLYIADTGLFITLAFKNKSFTSNELYQKLLLDKLPSNLGYVFENVVAQMLRSSGYDLYYHTFDRPYTTHKYEIDFLIEKGEKLYPIEVKSGQSSVHSSIDAFMALRGKSVGEGYLLCTKDIRREERVLRLPVFMAGVL